jgi:homoserine/homoserine lactone efflux protein
MTFQAWLIFVFIWTATTLPIGPNVINCVAISQNQGLKRSLWTIPGIACAALIHITIGLTGLAAIIRTDALLFAIVKGVGAAYMLYMAYHMWRDRGADLLKGQTEKVPRLLALRQGFIISITNPKAIFVNIAIFSQFIDAEQILWQQLSILIPTALIIDALIYAGYCALGVQLGKFLRSAKRQKVFNRTTGVIYSLIGLGLLTYQAPK